MEILESLTDKDLGVIKNPKYHPEKNWIVSVIYSLDPSNPIFQEQKQDLEEFKEFDIVF